MSPVNNNHLIINIGTTFITTGFNDDNFVVHYDTFILYTKNVGSVKYR